MAFGLKKKGVGLKTKNAWIKAYYFAKISQMTSEEFQKYIAIIETQDLAPSQYEEKAIQIADIIRFKESYTKDFTIVDCYNTSLNIIKNTDGHNGVLFFDQKTPNYLIEKPTYLKRLKASKNLNQLWLVFVEEEFPSDFQKPIQYIEQNNLDGYYDKIFLFNFFQSTIHELK